MQREITAEQKIFDENGTVSIAGWSRADILEYNRNESKISGRHKGIDSYYIGNKEITLYISIESHRKEMRINTTIADIRRGGIISNTAEKRNAIRRVRIDNIDEESTTEYIDNGTIIKISRSKGRVELIGEYEAFGGKQSLEYKIELNEICGDSLNQISPFERDRRYFYMKRFSPKYTASGIIKLGQHEYELSERSTCGYSDYTRLAKPRKHQYQRLTTDSIINGKRVTICLANRVGDNRYGNENSFFINGKITKLSQINVKSSGGRLDRPWYFRAGISAVDITFKPYTVKGEAMIGNMEQSKIIYGKLYGQIKHSDYAEPIILDNAQAHMILSEI